ncbi:hypothetical protein [Dyadobacter arcticus]|uniref:Uncharacterized protein n=1 Tax=Dyadobacter arcticus TaxID=1078754 RepID=A0ABX0UTA5_9BACT|nr:hypothetical protein [Dyadobacter arcticus]NIJ55149.1 hypothetical protein [Dyadobacter arcticus]
MLSTPHVNQTGNSGIHQNSEDQKGLKLSDFSFLASRKLLKNYRGSLSDVVIEDRKVY